MILLLLVRRSLRQHALSTAVTALTVSLAAGLLMSVWAVKRQSHDTFAGQSGGWDAVLGARGSKLQLVLNAVFHLEASPGNVSFADYEAIRTNRAVAATLPLAIGDNYRGYRLVGTLTNLPLVAEFGRGQHLELEVGGRWFEDGYREAVVGSFAAARLGLKLGDKFHPYHGLNFDPRDEHQETYVVVGIAKPSNTPMDRVLWIPIEGIQNMSGHDPAAADEISAVLVKLRSPIAGQQLDLLYNRQGTQLTFAWPIAREVAYLFDRFGWFDRILSLVAWLVAVVAAGSILASMYNSMSARQRELAILRALGARRPTVFAAIIAEAVAVALLGLLPGYLFYLGIVASAAAVIRAQTGVVISPFQWDAVLLWAPGALIILSAAAGVLPAIKAYGVDVAGGLAPES